MKTIKSKKNVSFRCEDAIYKKLQEILKAQGHGQISWTINRALEVAFRLQKEEKK